MVHILADNSTILFVVVAGYLFTLSTAQFRYVPYLINKVQSVLLPYLILTTPAALLYVFKIKTNHWWVDMDWFYSLNPVVQYLYMMGTGAHLGPLWFIPMIVLFYLLSPAWIGIQKAGLLRMAFFGALIVGVYVGRPLVNNNPFWAFWFFLPAYLLGMVLAECPDWYEKFSAKSAVYLPAFFVCMYGTYAVIDMNDHLDLLFKLLMSVLLMAFCKQYASRKLVWLDLFGRLSFFLFFVHGYVAGVLRLLYQRGDIPFTGLAPVLGIFVVIVVASVLSYIPAKMLLRKHSKYVLGA